MPSFLASAVKKAHWKEKETHASLSHIKEFAFLIILDPAKMPERRNSICCLCKTKISVATVASVSTSL